MDLTRQEFSVLRDYIREQCGICVPEDKSYLIESRLAGLVAEIGARDFADLYRKAQDDDSLSLQDRIIDAITTNETSWFRDGNHWLAIRELVIPALFNRLRTRQELRVRIWSAACSTGQEIYSFGMLLREYANRKGDLHDLIRKFEMIGTDISPSALRVAASGRYNTIAMSRGLNDRLRREYFTADGDVSVLLPSLRKSVRFEKFNLQNDFTAFGKFDLILLRNVSIYFADDFKRTLFHRAAEALFPGGILFLGASESLLGYSTDFERREYKKASYYVRIQ